MQRRRYTLGLTGHKGTPQQSSRCCRRRRSCMFMAQNRGGNSQRFQCSNAGHQVTRDGMCFIITAKGSQGQRATIPGSTARRCKPCLCTAGGTVFTILSVGFRSLEGIGNRACSWITGPARNSSLAISGGQQHAGYRFCHNSSRRLGPRKVTD